VVSDYERALHVEGRRQLGLFALEGFRLIERALATNTPLTHILIGKSAPNDSSPRLQKILEKLTKQSASVVSVPDPVMEKLLEGRTLGPILALARIPTPPDLPQLLTQIASSGARNKILVLDEMMDPGNVGALIRTAHAMGVACVITLGGTDPFHPRAARTSMGSVLRVPIIRLPNIDPLLPLLREYNVFTIGATGDALTLLPKASVPDQTVALFVGNEGKGLSPTVRASLNLLVAIPMSETIDSFSINAATAIILYAISYPPNLPMRSEPK
jgi:TrmH family RNA methyltransferase